MAARPRIVLKLGGELLEQAADVDHVARGIAMLATKASKAWCSPCCITDHRSLAGADD